MPYTDEWKNARRDGSIINVQFSDGTRSKARWSFELGIWQVANSAGQWKAMSYFHGNSADPIWWP